ncbi:hypothetical protein PANDA_014111, partial [Ailuropoda melanoleuca]
MMGVKTSYSISISGDRTGCQNTVLDTQADSETVSMRKLAKDMDELALEGAERQAEAGTPDREASKQSESNNGTPSS